ncbi:MAG TPA: PAS domain-containing protein [Vicinamibacterales bacterium]|nr:PAS domain-containing protein [Vicinamibacterales bacterium]
MQSIPNASDILAAVLDATPDAIFVKDLEGRYVLVNQAAARFVGRTPHEVVGKNDFELYPEETARRFVQDDKAVLETGTAMSFEGVASSTSGTQAYLVTKGVYRDKDGKILGIYGISHDITELRSAQDSLEQTRAALFRSQKMEAVGQLTGGIAHDFNNILMVILGNLELLRMRLPHVDDPTLELIDETLRATRHGQDLTGDLLAFSRRRQLNPQPVAINALVENIVRMLTRTLGASIRITTAASRDAGVALVDPAALEAAILNIALNARDAMPGGGTLTIRTSKADVTQAPRTDDDLPIGKYAMLAIQDTGSGMPPDVVQRVFEPFFTTKTAGTGSGLGLSMVYGFAKQSGGMVTIASEVGRGTTVILYLPLTQSKPVTDTEPALPVNPKLTSYQILVVEDEASVRSTIRRQLEMLGHTVVLAENANAALPILRGSDRVDVLLTDLVLGTGMNGIDLADAARVFRKTLPVIFMSGFSAVPEAQQRINESGAPLLTKPSTLSQLERALNTVTSGNAQDISRP